jgi:2-polyprenyl-3-methyl-5-hydroxy-6-metoxy-1,4-benzoquinol methylase
MFPLLSIFRRRIASPSFILQTLNRISKGKVVDVGCGDGQFLDAAKQLGWSTLGIEMDPEAVKIVRASGHDVIQGTYEALADFDNEIDCVICSHVLEHVHDPKSLLLVISGALKVGGTALISLPNAGSIVLLTLQENWRGLEAPRHLAIPTFEGILNLTRALGFETEATFVSRLETLDESLAIAELRGTDMQELRKKLALMQDGSGRVTETNSDFINLILKKTVTQSQLPVERY